MLEERVPKLETGLGSGENCIPEGVGLLGLGVVGIVAASEGVESSQLVPPRTEFLSRISSETADVGSNHLEAIHLVHKIVSN